MSAYDWADYLNVADDLLAKVGGEGAERSAISRAYYACYGKAWRYADANQAPLTGLGSDHRAVWDWFLTEPGPGPSMVRTRVGEYGKRLKNWRIIADYRDSSSGLPKTSNTAMAIARQVLADLAALP